MWVSNGTKTAHKWEKKSVIVSARSPLCRVPTQTLALDIGIGWRSCKSDGYLLDHFQLQCPDRLQDDGKLFSVTPSYGLGQPRIYIYIYIFALEPDRSNADFALPWSLSRRELWDVGQIDNSTDQHEPELKEQLDITRNYHALLISRVMWALAKWSS